MSSGMFDDDTKRTINEGRATLGEFVIAVRNEFRKVFLVFALGLVGTVVAMQYYVWDILRGVTEAQMSQEVSSQYEILVRTPFDVILLQVKIGMAVGLVLALPIAIYYSRDGLRRRGIWPNLGISRWKVAGIALLSALLFAGGGAYAYYVFFPVMFDFLTSYTIQVGFAPNYDVVMWTQFIILLTASFGLAGQLPLVMSGLAYTEVVPYETFREKWRHAVVGIFVFGAFFSPPDPFTQIMWAVPLLILYGISLYFAKLVTAIHRGGSAQVAGKLKANWNRVAGVFVLAGAGVFYLVTNGVVDELNGLLARAPPNYRYEIVLDGLPLAGQELAIALGVAWGAAITFPVLVYYAWPELEPRDGPAGLDIDELSADGIRAAPPSLFADLSEEEALTHAQRAMSDDDPGKARAILDRHDEATEAEERADDDPDRPDNMAEEIGAPQRRSAGDVAQERATGVVNAFTEDEVTEEDIGGYYYDITFILQSLTSKMFRIVGLLMATIAVVFVALYQGGIEVLKEDFLSRLPQSVVPEGGVDIVALHPVEAILFEVKVSVIVGVVVTLPLVVYYAWPAIEQRFLGITREFETRSPGAQIVAHWNQVAGAAVVGAGGTYYALTEGLFALPSSVGAYGVTLSGTMLTYGAIAVAGLLPALALGSLHAGASVKERIDHGGKQNVFLLWAATLVGGLVVGSVLGYAYIAPVIISYLVEDSIRAEMIIAYRITNFFWLIFATTIGIGLLADIPLTMWLFHRGGIVSFDTMRGRWRETVVGIFAISGLATPGSILSMFLMAFPVAVAYLLGLGGLWAVTLPWRIRDRMGRALGGG